MSLKELVITDLKSSPPAQRFEIWRECWADILVQSADSAAQVSEIPANSMFDGRLWAAQIGALLWFCTEHDPVATVLNHRDIQLQSQPIYFLLLPFRQRHFEQFNQDMLPDASCFTLTNSDMATTLRSPGRQKTLGLSIPHDLLGAELRARLQKQVLLIPCKQGMAYALRSLLLDVPRSLMDNDTLLLRQQFAGQLLSLLHLAIDTPPTAPKLSPEQLHLDAALREMESNLSNAELSCAMIAKKLGISESYLYKVFQRHNKRFSDELRNRRLQSLAKMLRAPHLAHYSIGWLAIENGFSSPSYCARSFKEVFGCSPSEYRQSGD